MTDPVLASVGARAACVAIHPGRSLALSPEWQEDEPSILFDRNSGDYWVIAPTARQWIEHLMHSAHAIPAEFLIEAVPPEVRDDAETALKQLIKLDIFRDSSD
ncbi:hypothetical protein G3580_05415 [Nitrogeniibacter mangrovi]|uniref:PqqD family protein n=1 Tax=Nitrogeniibacter mangrovi TaxID=2016596 RepID=A0A6C1B2B5_9RHOO|nr:hypothetical protein [Nitrogeniibacter mangrovi]QID17129.1 hypothetical protein G3580_05415 [Nitrogeniibacter mangrovi]